METLKPYLRLPATRAWGVLVLATIAAWIIGADHRSLVSDVAVATAIVVVIAFVKVQLVGLYFMELDHAPRGLLLLFSAWALVTCAVIIGIYLWA